MLLIPIGEIAVFFAETSGHISRLDGRVCPPTAAIFDPSCRTKRKTHREVAYKGYGIYREGCT